MKWLIQIALETYSDELYCTHDLLTEYLEPLIRKRHVKNHIKVVNIQYSKIKDKVFKLQGYKSKSGGRFDIVSDGQPFYEELFD